MVMSTSNEDNVKELNEITYEKDFLSIPKVLYNVRHSYLYIR